jgi:cysteine desulfurase
MVIYLDHAATSPMGTEVLRAYSAVLGLPGNPSSIHGAGQAARDRLERGREQVAVSLGAEPVEVVFTSGGTEAVNLGIKGLFWAADGRRGGNAAGSRRRVIVPRGEHHATIDSVEWLACHEGAEIDWIDVDDLGRIRLDHLAAALADPDDVALVTALWANNEVGTLQPVAEIVRIAAAVGAPVHLDAIAAYGWVPIDFSATGAAALSVSAHKIGGPVGIGALLLARSAQVEPLIHGGNQQRARSGTQDAAGSVAFGTAAEIATRDLDAHATWIRELRKKLISDIVATVPGAILRGDPAPAGRLPGNAHLTFPGCEGDSLLFLLDVAGFAVSTGSACQAGAPEASHVLLAMGIPEAEARGALRITLGADTTESDIDALVGALPGVVAQAREAGLAGRRPALGAR